MAAKFFTPLVSSSDHTGSTRFNLSSRNHEALEDIARLCMNLFHSQAQKNSHPCAKSILASAVDFYCLCRWSLTDLNSSGLACELKKGVGSRNSSEGREDGRGRSREECATCEQLPPFRALKLAQNPQKSPATAMTLPFNAFLLLYGIHHRALQLDRRDVSERKGQCFQLFHPHASIHDPSVNVVSSLLTLSPD